MGVDGGDCSYRGGVGCVLRGLAVECACGEVEEEDAVGVGFLISLLLGRLDLYEDCISKVKMEWAVGWGR